MSVILNYEQRLKQQKIRYILGSALEPKEALEISDSQLSDLDINYLLRLYINLYDKKKTCIYADNNNLTYVGLSFLLDRFTNITSINISKNNLNDECMKMIAYLLKHSNYKLKVLDLSSNLIGANGVLYLSEALKTNTSLIELDLSVNDNIGSIGVNYLGDMLKVNKSLIHLNIFDVCCVFSQLLPFAQGISDNTTLVDLGIGCNNCLTRDEPDIIDTRDNRDSIEIHHLAQVLILILTSRSIKYLYLVRACIDDMIIKLISTYLENNTELKYLYLTDNYITDNGIIYLFEKLKYNRALSYLDISHNLISDGCCNDIALSLRVNESLQEICITHTEISNNGLEDIYRGLAMSSNYANTNKSLINIELVYDETDANIHIGNLDDIYEDNDERLSLSPDFINMLETNKMIYWTPWHTNLFNKEMRNIIITTFLCNELFSVRIPTNILIQILSFFNRSNFICLYL